MPYPEIARQPISVAYTDRTGRPRLLTFNEWLSGGSFIQLINLVNSTYNSTTSLIQVDYTDDNGGTVQSFI